MSFQLGNLRPVSGIRLRVYRLFSCFGHDPEYQYHYQGYQEKSPPHAGFKNRLYHTTATKKDHGKKKEEYCRL